MDANSKVIPLELHPMGFIESFIHFGGKLNELLENTGITEAMLSSKGVKISYNQQAQLLKNGIRSCNQPGIGLKVGSHIDWSFNGSVGAVVNCAPSLRDAGSAMRRFLLIAQPYYAMYVYQPAVFIDEHGMMVGQFDSRTAKLIQQQDESVTLFELEYRLAVTLRLYDACGNKSVPNPSVHARLAYPRPSHAHLYDELPCDSVTFGCDISSVSAHYLFVIEPWREFRRANFDHLIEQCEEELKVAHIEDTTTAKVRWHVSMYFNKQVTLEEIADLLSMTPRSLTRKLANEGTSFRAIVHDVRMELTAFHLRASKLNVDEISELMGFSSASSLRRAIKNWSGETVGAIRADEAALHCGLSHS